MNIFKILRQNLHLKDELKPKLVLHVSKEPEPVIEYIGIGKVENEGYYEQCGPDDQKCNFDNIIENLTKEKAEVGHKLSSSIASNYTEKK